MMSTRRKLTLVSTALLIALTTACGLDSRGASSLTGPEQAPSRGLLSGLLPTLFSCPSTQSYTASQLIGPAGGVLTVGPHSLSVPQGALSSTVLISATAPAGNYVAVRFQPEGLQFATPSRLTMSYRQCGLVQGLLLQVVYVDGQLRILELLSSLNDLLHRTVSAKVSHFSSYMLAH
jgi:hypothetical protein